MISDFIVNISILISFTFLWHHLFKKSKLTTESDLKLKLVDGVIAGFFGIVLMHYSLSLNDTTILDMRHVPIAMVALYGGFLTAMVSSIVVITGHYFLDMDFPSNVALIMILLIGTGTGMIGQYSSLSIWKKWTVMLIYAQVLFTSSIFIVSDLSFSIAYPAFLHMIFSFIGGYVVIYFARYMRKATDSFYEIQENARKDPLTGLLNVRSFDHYYNYFVALANDTRSISLIIIDIDHFKKINDTYGHIAGDQILIETARLIKVLTGDRGYVARNGGEEFTVLLPEYKIQETIEIAETIRQNIEEHLFTIKDNKKMSLTVSIGAAHLQTLERIDHDLFDRADQALYNAKKSGRNKVCIA
ncbi:sensor domain-containing diguanylate cyclase [Jeotgalibacillus sp. R-1-5s-1]|uniref:GGDEF domain-containing protein n=1 Tax=Jeotgalibacillus sp. R-1-5s-1 TaxID=2555897 RepID=UPI00106A13A6|nr:sensor domain-containing diguanylate cyclase [Jeotgalibacillus sp. R-1-5s-1]TFD97098.1 sensor domain-containing diguanylate cyclase [Jeotgalibacillus sp. R-1-5s-1]